MSGRGACVCRVKAQPIIGVEFNKQTFTPKEMLKNERGDQVVCVSACAGSFSETREEGAETTATTYSAGQNFVFGAGSHHRKGVSLKRTAYKKWYLDCHKF